MAETPRKKLYLAGPDVFRPQAQDFLQRQKALCQEYGFEGLAPVDNGIDLEPGEEGTKSHSRKIFEANCRLMEECDGAVANLTAFRGAGIDDGTAFELGYAYALGKPLMGYTADWEIPFPQITRRMFDLQNQPEFTLLEDFGDPVNLMIIRSIEASGGKLLPDLQACLSHLRETLEAPI